MHRALAQGFLLILMMFASLAGAQTFPQTQLTLAQARQLAVHALRTGQPGLAIELSKGLLQANRRDPLAYYVIAQAYAGQNQPNLARRAATRAYRFSDNGPARFQAGQLAARMAYSEGKPSLAQVWLRRTVLYAPSDQAKALVAQDYRTVRLINPWSLQLKGGLRPSKNINNGSDSALQVIDGVPVTGILSGTAQALSGVVGSLDAKVGYRFRNSDTSLTALGGRIVVQRVRLSSEARALAPTASNSDYSSTFGEVSLLHRFAVGPPEKNGSASVSLALGENWFSGQRSYRFAKLGAERLWNLDQDRTTLILQASGEARNKARFQTSDATILGLTAKVTRKLGNGNSLSTSLALRDIRARHHNGTYRLASLVTNYSWAKPIGPARISAGVLLGFSDYPVYRSGGLILVPGGRQDKSIYADVSLFFEDYDLGGFAPVLRLRAGRKSSNDSRFSTRDFSLSLSIQSKF